jgi:hypothetical protein
MQLPRNTIWAISIVLQATRQLLKLLFMPQTILGKQTFLSRESFFQIPSLYNLSTPSHILMDTIHL